MTEPQVEPQVRMVVSEQLGVVPELLVPDVVLGDELAADSLDMLELLLALEAKFQVKMPARAWEGVRTYRDLVSTVRASCRRTEAPVAFWARLTAARQPRLEQSGELTPYATEMLLEAAGGVGAPARLELVVARETSDAFLEGMRHRFGALRRHGMEVSVRRRAMREAVA